MSEDEQVAASATTEEEQRESRGGQGMARRLTLRRAGNVDMAAVVDDFEEERVSEARLAGAESEEREVKIAAHET